MNVYSKNNRYRARLTETSDGITVAFDQFSGVERRGVNVLKLDTADLPKDAVWRQISVGVINDQPFHVVRDLIVHILELKT